MATGREGFGGEAIPSFLHDLPQRFYVHTNEEIEAQYLKGKKIAILGAGASAFDAAAFALENGASQVDILARRSEVPTVNKFSQFSFPGILHGFYSLPDEMHAQLFVEAFISGIPPTKEALDRVKDSERLCIYVNASILGVEVIGNEVILHTAIGKFTADLIIAATGFAVDGWLRPELRPHMPAILLWDEKLLSVDKNRVPILKAFPYLGKHFQFLEKVEGEAPYLKNMYCFNYGAFLSHGLISGDIPGISFGACRLAKGIAADFFMEDFEYHKRLIEAYNTPVFKPKDLPKCILQP